MAYSAKTTVLTMENEARMWWRLSQRNSELLRQRNTPERDAELAEVHDEIDVLRLMTDWQSLHAAATKQLQTNAALYPGQLEAVA